MTTTGSDSRAPGGPASAVPDHEIPAYPDLSYRDVFWADRHYEDRADRTAVRALLPPTGERIVDVGAGYGRLAGEYAGYGHVVLFDASEAHVAAARERLRDDPRFEVVQGDAYHLPFADATFDTAVCVRVVHHLEHPGAMFAELARVLRPGGALVLEFANKRNLKAILRYWLRRQRWSPFDDEPVEYLPLHFDRSPVEMRRLLRAQGLVVERTRTASLFRMPLVSRHVPAAMLVAIERPLQRLLAPVTAGPSVFVRARKPR